MKGEELRKKREIFLKKKLWRIKIVSPKRNYGLTRPSCSSSCNLHSQSAMKLPLNPEQHPKSKHIDMRMHYIKLAIKSGVIKLEHVGDPKQPANLLPKSVVKIDFQEKRNILGVTLPQT